MLNGGSGWAGEPVDPGQLLGQPEPSQLGPQMLGCDDDQTLQFVDRLGPAHQMPCRVTNTCRSASRSPRSRGVACSVWASAVRAAWTASIRSFLAPRERLLFWISTTSSPASDKTVTKPAAKLPVPSNAQTRRPGAQRTAQASIRR